MNLKKLARENTLESAPSPVDEVVGVGETQLTSLKVPGIFFSCQVADLSGTNVIGLGKHLLPLRRL